MNLPFDFCTNAAPVIPCWKNQVHLYLCRGIQTMQEAMNDMHHCLLRCRVQSGCPLIKLKKKKQKKTSIIYAVSKNLLTHLKVECCSTHHSQELCDEVQMDSKSFSKTPKVTSITAEGTFMQIKPHKCIAQESIPHSCHAHMLLYAIFL